MIIGRLTGTVAALGLDHVLIDVNGVGYVCQAGTRLLSRLHAGDETVLEAASRELYEETGYRAPEDRLHWLMRAPSSAGLTDEVVELVLARDVTRSGRGGGVDGERIELLIVPLDELEGFLDDRAESGVHIDLKVRLVPLLARGMNPEVSR